MRSNRAGRSILVMVLALAGAACARHRFQVEYVPIAPPPQVVQASVVLQVVVARPFERGGPILNHVGTVRSTFGIPRQLIDPTPDVVPRTVWAATADALGQAGIGASVDPAAARNRLVATVLEYWVDGYVGYGCHIVVRYQLVDRAGRELWNATVVSGGGGPGAPPAPYPTATVRSPKRLAGDLFAFALGELEARGRAEFAAPGFQRALAR